MRYKKELANLEARAKECELPSTLETYRAIRGKFEEILRENVNSPFLNRMREIKVDYSPYESERGWYVEAELSTYLSDRYAISALELPDLRGMRLVRFVSIPLPNGPGIEAVELVQAALDEAGETFKKVCVAVAKGLAQEKSEK